MKRTLQVRLDDAEYGILLEEAEKAGVTLSKFMRGVIRSWFEETGLPEEHRPENIAGIDIVLSEAVSPSEAVVVSGSVKTIHEAKRNFKPGQSVDQFGYKRDLSKPTKKK
jgi:hypothetical protein